MHQRGKRAWAAAILLGAGAIVGGCQSDAGTGTLIGAGAGAGLGAIVGHNVGSGHTATGAAIGAAAGAGGGYLIGRGSDQRKARAEREAW